jgi:UDP-GlcNAc:undecaprenyl-phosphate GlcNAc-1-phosphate transferase
MASVLFFSFVCSAILAAGLTWALRDLALARGWIRTALPERHLNPVSMPRLGGIAIATAVLALSCVGMLAALALHYVSKDAACQLLLVLFAALIPCSVGAIDDFFDISPWMKLAAEVAAGLLLWVGGIRVVHLASLFHSHQFGATVSILLTLFWVTLISNAFNLIDGIDGLAAGSALFSVLTVFVISLATHNLPQSLLAVILAGAILGFLRYNFNPATIYLGDCGSLFIGTFLAGLTLTGTTQQKSSTLVAVAIPLVAFGLPVVETAVSVIRRFLRGQPIFEADREHFHHKLLDRGWSQRQVAVVLYAVSALFGLLSLALLTPGQAPIAVVLLVLGIGVVVGVQKLGYHEFVEIGRVAHRAFEQKQVIVNNIAVRRGAEKLANSENWHEMIEALQDTFAENDFDGFQIRIQATNNDAIARNYQWQRPIPRWQRGREHAGAWSLNLRLQLLPDEWGGSLELSRQDSSDLLLDVNLLTGELRTELERACLRALVWEENLRLRDSGHVLTISTTLRECAEKLG